MSRQKIKGAAVSGMILVMMSLASASVASSQIEWLKDVSSAKIPAGKLTGQINGKTVTATFGKLYKSGYISFGDLVFDHYQIELQDAETGFDSKFFVELTLTVRKGELPDGKTFRRIFAASLEEQPGPKGNGIHALAEMYSLTMRSRRDPKPGADAIGSGFDVISHIPEPPFTGRLELDKRREGKIAARLYLCFDDKLRSCVAGTTELSVRDPE